MVVDDLIMGWEPATVIIDVSHFACYQQKCGECGAHVRVLVTKSVSGGSLPQSYSIALEREGERGSGRGRGRGTGSERLGAMAMRSFVSEGDVSVAAAV